MERKNRRGLLTPSEREVVQQEWNGKTTGEKSRLYQARTRIQNKIDELEIDLLLLHHNQPEIYEEVVSVLTNSELPESEISEIPPGQKEPDEHGEDAETISIELDSDQVEHLRELKERRGYTWKGLLIESASEIKNKSL